MTTLMDLVKDPTKAIPTEAVKGVGKITTRRYDIIGHKIDGTLIEHRNLSAVKANQIRKQLRKEGCHAVDKIEVLSSARVTSGDSKLLTFPQPNTNFNRVVIPEAPVEEKPNAVQMTIAWEIDNRTPNAVLAAESKKLEIDRQKEHNKKEGIRNAKAKSTETRSEPETIIYDKMSGKAIFAGTEGQAVFFLANNKIPLVNVVIYMNNKTYAKAVK